ncbi:hypothetical protein BpHYR1_047176 [Brachionus plicatilis]|uniref:Uncharacterized protein n=1 Tax=Brachionus plicatilis TaxID=10195 RepID=A0A3M7S1Y1_BRAPC|nr:hypothetical protein BpHYR1_047176 [Brachionus plicatilis]
MVGDSVLNCYEHRLITISICIKNQRQIFLTEKSSTDGKKLVTQNSKFKSIQISIKWHEKSCNTRSNFDFLNLYRI